MDDIYCQFKIDLLVINILLTPRSAAVSPGHRAATAYQWTGPSHEIQSCSGSLGNPFETRNQIEV